MKVKILFSALCALTVALPVQAEEISQNVVGFSTEARQEIEPDVLQVSLFYQAEGNNLSVLNKTVSGKLNQAVQLAKENDVTIKDNARNVNVRYKDNKQSGWIDRGEIVLESRDFERLSQLVSQLDGVLAIENVSTSVSAEKQAKLEQDLTRAALEKFRQKAELIQQSLGMKGYQILNLEVQNVSREVPYPARNYTYAAKAVMADEALAESGRETVRAVINARIALLKD